MTVYTELLKLLADYSEKLDLGAVTNDDFGEFQQLKGRIQRAYKTGYFKRPEYSALNAIYFYLHESFRVVLHLDTPQQAEVKAYDHNSNS